jgi:F-type H+-transporting ATPase subunit c
MDLVSVANAVTTAAAAVDGAVAQPVVANGGVDLGSLGPGLALGLAVVGAGYCIGKLAAAALEGTARQPEAAGKLQGMMILAIAFIEALALIALLFGAFVIA